MVLNVTETVRLIRDGEKGGWGGGWGWGARVYGGGGEGDYYTYLYTVTTVMYFMCDNIYTRSAQ